MAEPKWFNQLKSSFGESQRAMRPFLQKRWKYLTEMAASSYCWRAKATPNYVNLFAESVNTMTNTLASTIPAYDIGVKDNQLKRCAFLMQESLNLIVKRMKLGDTLKRIVRNSQLDIGIRKIALEPKSPRSYLPNGWVSDLPFMESIDLDDWVHDLSKTNLAQCEFFSDKYRVRLEDVKDDPRFDKNLREKVSAVPYRMVNRYGQEKGQNLNRMADGAIIMTEVYDMTELRDIYLPKENRLITVVDYGSGPEALLRDVEWGRSDSQFGPYDFLFFNEIPDNTFPLAPADLFIDLHMANSATVRKLVNQSLRQKNLTVVQNGGEKDGNTIRNAGDGDMVGVANIDKVKEYKYGGIDQSNYVFTQGVIKEWFNYVSNNLMLQQGTGEVTKTATQDSILNNATNKGLAQMQMQYTKFLERIGNDLAFYLFTDPKVKIPILAELGDSFQLPMKFTSKEIKGEFMDYEFKIKPYSQTYLTPQQEFQQFQQVMQVMGPFMPALAQKGINPDPRALLEFMENSTGLTSLSDIFDYSMPGSTALTSALGQALPGASGGSPSPSTGGPGQADQTTSAYEPQTNSTYTRVSTSPGRQSPTTANEMPANPTQAGGIQ